LVGRRGGFDRGVPDTLDLRSQGVSRETFVGIFLNRSLEMIIVVLAILKSGGTYVPISPTYPKDRINFMLEDSKISFLITQRALLEKVQYLNADTIVSAL